MNRALFLELSEQPHRVEFIHIEGLGELVKSFPFFQAAKVLHCLALKRGQEIGYSDALKSAALHTSDRRRLFEILEKREQAVRENVVDVVSESQEQKSALDFQFEAEEQIKNVMKQAIPADEIIRQLVEYPLIIERSKTEEVHQEEGKLESRLEGNESKESNVIAEQLVIVSNVIENKEEARELLAEENSFLFWLKKVSEQPALKKEKVVESSKEALPSKSKEELIEMFIKTEPRISTPQKVDFYSPLTMSKKSSEDSEEIVSETLAKVYEAQGNVGKAIRIYQKLSLLYPEKISYFAARIKNLEKTDLL